MKLFLLWVGKKMANALITAVFFLLAVLGIVYVTINWPIGNPGGTEVTGGKFTTYFNKVFDICPTGKVLQGYNINTGKVCVPSGGGQSSGIPIYQCPNGSGGWNPGGYWADYHCVGQIGIASTCTNTEYPNIQTRNCDYIGILWKE